MDEFEISRKRMVEKLRDHYRIKDERVLDAMSRIPRHFFVPEALKSQAYRDNALPIPGNQTISQPLIVARMTELLKLDEDSKVLEIGAGSGYQTAILALLASRVYAIERVEELAARAEDRLDRLGIKNATVKCGDGTLGWEMYSPYDAILVAAGGPDVPGPLLDQLADGGRLVIPIGSDQKSQTLVRLTRNGNEFVEEDCGRCAFVPLIGEHGWEQTMRQNS